MHEYRIQIILAVLLVFLLYKLLRSVLKKKLEIKYVLSWIIVDFCLLIIDLFPSILTFLCKCLGIQLASNMIFLVAGLWNSGCIKNALRNRSAVCIITHQRASFFLFAGGYRLIPSYISRIFSSGCSPKVSTQSFRNCSQLTL